ncbi:hypothetical protein DICPUDRAFT_77063 [Dictyostelium purpureum]|uniref:Uncharacterized protein n=1 Tax=Dictyostelium purpureum TaxID=5786 RepID=F0ZFH2_DICPU|nr:uncharacterized protein DICPUDRAFT_77063 [Dictyostelium purpureum]EGC37275.1 hypothetical protein DICPUDRAFT_77063 [Dictyostelium purpureum]|eukprot:XP_003286163.1 hypothetical protein DICPUDRAFT_77063 [Dictyostelium purpureum]
MDFSDFLNEKLFVLDDTIKTSSVKGSTDLKLCLVSAISLTDFIKSSLGPKSGDKLIVDENGDIIVTNDGYSIIKYLSRSSKIESDNDNSGNNSYNIGNNINDNNNNNNNNNNNTSSNNQTFSNKSTIERKRFQSIIELLIDTCRTQERLYGDGTTSVLVLVGALCSNAMKLIYEKGIPPHKVVESFQKSLKIALKLLNNYYLPVKTTYDNSNTSIENNCNEITLEKVTQSSLLSKSISFYKKELTNISIQSVNLIFDYCKSIYNNNKIIDSNNNNNINNDINKNNIKIDQKRIKIKCIEGSKLEDTKLIKGVLIKRFFSHKNMPKIIVNSNILVLSCPLEFPKPKTNFSITVNSLEEYESILKVKSQYYQNIIAIIEAIGVTNLVIVCQWGIDQEINQYLSNKKISAVCWVPGDDLERISSINNYIGHCERISEIVMGNDSSNRYIEFSGCTYSSTVTILVRGGSKEMCEETVQCLRDSIHIASGCLKNPKVVPSGGSTELFLYSQFQNQQFFNNSDNNKKEFSTIQIMAMRSWSESLLSIPITLLENGGYDCQDILMKLIKLHNETNINKYYGVDINNIESFDLYSCNQEKLLNENQSIIQDMKFKSWELLGLKKSILKLATETACMLLSIDSFISL